MCIGDFMNICGCEDCRTQDEDCGCNCNVEDGLCYGCQLAKDQELEEYFEIGFIQGRF